MPAADALRHTSRGHHARFDLPELLRSREVSADAEDGLIGSHATSVISSGVADRSFSIDGHWEQRAAQSVDGLCTRRHDRNERAAKRRLGIHPRRPGAFAEPLTNPLGERRRGTIAETRASA